MPHDTPLITMVVAGLVFAFILGAIAQRMRLSPLVGYLLAGVLIGSATPGYVADLGLAGELAEIGVIPLMFGVGLYLSLRDLMSVRGIAIPGALVQIAFATLLGAGLGWNLGWPPATGFVFGLALSVASTVVLLRALQERHLLESERGRDRPARDRSGDAGPGLWRRRARDELGGAIRVRGRRCGLDMRLGP